jgi:tRNA(Ile)-lysidine synthase
MKLTQDVIRPGQYVVAVSGGVDSMVLLDLLSRLPGLRLTVAHFDHGIRQDAAEDRRLVQAAAAELRLPFVYHEGRLGAQASEAIARAARYDFLCTVQQATRSQAIITAHHHNDVLETAILNMLRGTGRRGLSSLNNRGNIIRPLLNFSKDEIIDYAHQHEITWREDSTNQDPKYLRNYVRLYVMPLLKGGDRLRLAAIIKEGHRLNIELDELLVNQLHQQHVAQTLDRRWFASLPHPVAREVLASWLRAEGLRDFDRPTLERLTVQAKTGAVNRYFDVFKNYRLHVTKEYLALARDER